MRRIGHIGEKTVESLIGYARVTEHTHDFKILNFAVVKYCEKQVFRIDYVAFQHSGFKYAQFDYAVGQVADCEHLGAIRLLIEAVVESIAQLIHHVGAQQLLERLECVAFILGHDCKQKMLGLYH